MATSSSSPALMHKSLGVEGCKVLSSDDGIVEAFVSGIGNKDSVGDIILPGAFENSLKGRKPKGVWSHDWDRPVSKTLEIFEIPAGDPRLPLKMQLAGIGGLYVKTQFNMNTQLGRDAFETVKFFGDEAEWSIGYQVVDQEYDKKSKAMLLKEIELFEYSPVLFGANELTSTVSIKAHKGTDGEIEVEVEGLDEIEQKAVKAALNVILKEKSVTIEEDVDTKVDADSQEDAEMASEETAKVEKAEGEKSYSVAQMGELFLVVDDDSGEVCKMFTSRDAAEAYKAVEDAWEAVDDAFEAVDEAIAAAGEASAMYSEVTSPDEEEDDEDEMAGMSLTMLSEDDETETKDAEDDTEEKSEDAEAEVEVKTAETEDGIEIEIEFKAGRVLSKKNRSAIESALKALQEVLDADAKEEADDTEEKATPEQEAKDLLNVMEEAGVVETEEKSDDEAEVETKDAEVEVDEKSDEEEFVTDADAETEEKVEDAEVETKDAEESDTETEVDEAEVEEKAEESEVETKEADDEEAEEKADDAEVSDADFLRNLAEFEEFVSFDTDEI